MADDADAADGKLSEATNGDDKNDEKSDKDTTGVGAPAHRRRSNVRLALAVGILMCLAWLGRPGGGVIAQISPAKPDRSRICSWRSAVRPR